ncbi:hypothetical protein KXD40_002787 [Peronospora effusa]|nr:hypothetical protein KXD40_002787 [Peronospora effusa]
MPFKPNKAPLVKALFVIVLVVRSTMWLATADLSPEDALRTFQASGTLDTDLTPHASKQKRYLRSAVDVTTTSTGEVRRLVSDIPKLKELGNSLEIQAVAFPARLRRSVSTISSTTIREKLWLWVNKQKEPKEAFTSLQLDNRENPFENPKFSVWKYIVEKTKPERDVPREMFNIMVKALGDEGILAKFLAQSKSSTQFEDTVNSLYNHQIEQWLQYDYYTPKNVYNLLNLNKYDKIGEVPGRPEFSMWAAFNTRKGSVEKAFEFLKEPKRKIINPDLMRALAKIGEADGNYEFAQNLLHFQIQDLVTHYYYYRSPIFNLFKLQGKGTLNPTDLTTDPLGRLWVDYVYMRAQDEDGFTGLGEVFKKLELRVGHKAAVAVMKMVHKDGYFLKSLEKEKPIKEKENFDSF